MQDERTLVRLEVRVGRLRAQVRRPHRGAEHRLPGVVRDVLDGVGVADRRERVVHHHVEPAELGRPRSATAASTSARSRDVAADRAGLAAARRDLAGDDVTGLGAARRDHHVGAVRRARERDAAPDATTRAGDDDGLARRAVFGVGAASLTGPSRCRRRRPASPAVRKCASGSSSSAISGARSSAALAVTAERGRRQRDAAGQRVGGVGVDPVVRGGGDGVDGHAVDAPLAAAPLRQHADALGDRGQHRELGGAGHADGRHDEHQAPDARPQRLRAGARQPPRRREAVLAPGRPLVLVEVDEPVRARRRPAPATCARPGRCRRGAASAAAIAVRTCVLRLERRSRACSAATPSDFEAVEHSSASASVAGDDGAAAGDRSHVRPAMRIRSA